MIHIKKGNPWIFYPSSLCDTFPENPATKILSGDRNFQLEIRCTLLDTVDTNGTVFCILPKYMGLDIHKNLLFFTIKFEDGSSNFYQFPFQISNGVEINLKMVHVPNNYLKITINNEEQLNLDLKELAMCTDENPCIVFGANSYSHIDENSNSTELHVYEFKLYEKTKLLAHHTFDEFIFNKSVDKTGNLNFIHHKILEC
jgi:hypothetical protein